MEKLYIISFNDDNHEPHYWLNDKYITNDIDTIIKGAFELGQEMADFKGEYIRIDITPDTLPYETLGEEKTEQLFDYLNISPHPKLDKKDILLLDKAVNQDIIYWECFYKKNIKKIMRKGLTK